MKKREITNKLKSINLDFEYIITFDSALVMLGIKKECDYIFLSCNKTDIKNFDNIVFINNNYDIKNIVKIHNFNVANENILLKMYADDKNTLKLIYNYIESKDNHHYENLLNNKGYNLIAGTDEAGRGPLCGPVVAAAVILPKGYNLEGLTDSKKLTEKQREKFFEIIKKDAISYSISVIDNKKIDEINILEASRLAMNEAVNTLHIQPDFVITDAMDLHKSQSLGIIKGDAKSITIAAASVLAKVTRDHIMDEYDKIYPEYEFAKHKGYPTKRHLEILNKYGILDIYRTSYKPVRDLLERQNNENLQK